VAADIKNTIANNPPTNNVKSNKTVDVKGQNINASGGGGCCS